MNRIVAAIGIVAVLAAAYAFFVSPLESKRVEMQERLHIDYSTLSKYRDILSSRERIGPRLRETSEELRQMEENVFGDTSLSVAFAKLQKDVQGMASESGLDITSVKPLPTVSYEHYTGLPIYIDCRGSIRDFGRFLKKADSPEVFYSIDRLDISAAQGGELRIRMQLSGLMSSS